MSKRGGSGQDRRADFLKSIEKQKLDTVRWSLQFGGQNPGTRDDEGNTAIMIAASKGLRKAMQVLLEVVRKQREIETLDLTDGEGDGRTALMMAAAAGHYDIVKDLKDAGANWRLKCAEGHTAEDYAKRAGHAAIAAYFGRGAESSEESAGEEEEEGEMIEGESASQRRKRIKAEKAAKDTRGRSAAVALKHKQQGSDDEENSGDEGAKEGADAPAAAWPEVAKALEDAHVVQLTIQRTAEQAAADAGVIDPALWRCKHLNSLVLKMGPSLITLPDRAAGGPGALKALRTLVLSHNGLTCLPTSLCTLPLKVLEAEGNAITALPDGFSKLADTLETLQLSHNKLTVVTQLRGCKNLVSLSLDGNQLSSLEGVGLKAMTRLVTLSARNNKIAEIPDEVGDCAALAELYLSGNQIEDVPSALGNLKEKKVRVIELSGNPLSDPKVRKMLDKSSTFVKELLPYLRKGGGGGGKKGKGKKGKKAAESSEEEEEEEEEEEQKEEEKSAAPAEPPKPPAATPTPTPAQSSKPMSKKEMLKEKERLERKAAEEAMKTKQLALAEKAKEKEAQRLAQLEEMAQGGGGSNEDEDDDEMGWESAPKRGAGAGSNGAAKPSGGYMYSMTPEQLKEAEAKEAKRLEEERKKKEEDEMRKKMTQDEQEAARAEQRMRELALKDKKAGDHYVWEFLGGQLLKKHLEAGQQPPRLLSSSAGKLPTNAYSVTAELPAPLVGRVIGKGGENIKATETKSGARVRVLQAGEAKLAPGMAGVQVSGTHASIESARALINKNLLSTGPPR